MGARCPEARRASKPARGVRGTIFLRPLVPVLAVATVPYPELRVRPGDVAPPSSPSPSPFSSMSCRRWSAAACTAAARAFEALRTHGPYNVYRNVKKCRECRYLPFDPAPELHRRAIAPASAPQAPPKWTLEPAPEPRVLKMAPRASLGERSLELRGCSKLPLEPVSVPKGARKGH